MVNTKNWFVYLKGYEEEILQTPFQKDVYLAIKSYLADGKLQTGISIGDIEKRSKVSRGQIYKVIPQLINLKLIEEIGEESRRGGKVPVYKLPKCSPHEHLKQRKCSPRERLNPRSVHGGDESVHGVGINDIQEKKRRPKGKELFLNHVHDDDKKTVDDLPPILSYVHRELIPRRKGIKNPESYAKTIAGSIAKKLLTDKEALLHPVEDNLKSRAFKARAELGLEPQSGVTVAISPGWSEADQLWFAVEHSYGVEFLEEQGYLK